MEQSADGSVGSDDRQTAAEKVLAELMVETLQLDLAAADIDPEAPLFGEGLGLDSIDALELALAVSRTYGVDLRSSDDQNRRVSASLRSLSAHIEASRKAAPKF
ncbi:MAG TPA: phosphopantetheine-binding protein [Crenalkalicoccus sp.]|jgi:acyl carrier protein|nr:phosphopantetheine-binding protein [Crenalkalicoccus sp.]